MEVKTAHEVKLNDLPLNDHKLHESLVKIYGNVSFSLSNYKHYSFKRMANTEHQLYICGNFTINKCLPMYRNGRFTFEISFYAFEDAFYTLYFFGHQLLEQWHCQKLQDIPKVASFIIDPKKEFSSEMEHWKIAISAA